jgi:hypothetical protein
MVIDKLVNTKGRLWSLQSIPFAGVLVLDLYDFISFLEYRAKDVGFAVSCQMFLP